ncbi:hypothetical protein IAR55_004305 [Kwoniella newhampshirensis]|uniref:NAD(P)-binding domain-containing protein n=1 Tax=Kwoniella newhampshirensis TaxID=1651941 RepID=A0AAW0YXH0_9TREE
MSKIVITGATGNAGSAVLNYALSDSSVSAVSVLSRRPPFVTHPKLTHIALPSAEHPQGFDEIPSDIIAKLKAEGYNSCIWALGISQTLVSKDEYVKITHTYATSAAKAFSTIGTPTNPFRFVYMSGEGAEQDESGRALFSKIKGRTEKDLNILAKEQAGFEVVSVRPGGIYPAPDHIPRMHWIGGPLLRVSGTILKLVYPSIMIDSPDLAKACVMLAKGKGWEEKDAQGVIANAKLKKLAKE